VLPLGQSSDSCRGPDEIQRFWKGLEETFEELRREPKEFVDAGDHVATRLCYYGRGRESGIEIEEEHHHRVTTFRAGRMVRVSYYTEWSEALEAVRTGGSGRPERFASVRCAGP
jgi:ketosteroid isomerase-like protein